MRLDGRLDGHLISDAWARSGAVASPLLATAGGRVGATTKGRSPASSTESRAETRERHGDQVAAACAFLAARYRDPIRLGEVAKAVGSSPFHLARIFKRVMGVSVHAYLDRLRLEAALAELTQGTRSLTDLAYDLGFSSHSHFTTRFTRAFGLPPSAIRAAARDKRRDPLIVPRLR
jgi:AraC-like DNA-binding protein